jgi:glycosyltransferase involved in cell wall biosynthesis
VTRASPIKNSSNDAMTAAIDPIRICVDGRMLDQSATGVASYARTLVATLQGAGHAPLILRDGGPSARRPGWANGLAAARPGTRTLDRVADGYQARDIFREAHIHFSLHGRLLTLTAPGPPGVMHWTYPVPLRIDGWRNIYTVHDAIPLNPTLTSPVNPGRHRRLLDRILERADRIVTVSEAAKAEIVFRLGCAAALVVNCSQAVDVTAPSPGPLPASLGAGEYFVFTGMIEERKNLERLIAAHRLAGTARPLVLVGPDGLGAERIMQAAGHDGAVLRLPFQARDTLLGILANARALLFPSLGEGFGLPVIEAMALGVPVMTSAGGALEEVAERAALLIDPYDVEEMARSIALLDRDVSLRRTLVAAGIARAALFTPPFYANRLLELYTEVA